MKVTFEVDGRIKFIYDDFVAEITREVGQLNIRRASHVEPTGPDGLWLADMSPVGGPALGPFMTRTIALQEERLWLITHGIPRPL
jgi:hypothetical protein